MSENQFVTLGYVRQAHGIRGGLHLTYLLKDEDLLDRVFDEGLLLKKNNEVKRYTVDSMKPHKEGYLFELEEVVDRNEAEKLKGWEWVFPKEYFVSNPGENIFLSEILGFEVYDKGNLIGLVQNFYSTSAQDLMVVERDGRKVDIPLIKPFIESIDFEKKQIHMQLPEGLIQ